MKNTNTTRSTNPIVHVLPPYLIGTLFYTVLNDGRVDVTFHEYTAKGNMRRIGQRYMIASDWLQALTVFAARETVRVIVRSEGNHP